MKNKSKSPTKKQAIKRTKTQRELSKQDSLDNEIVRSDDLETSESNGPSSPHLELEVEFEEPKPTIGLTLSIFADIFKNKNMYLFFTLVIVGKSAVSMHAKMTEVILTNDLGFPKETLASTNLVLIPLNFVWSAISGYLSTK